ncbi:hypothetical protein [Coralloluteibacterium thermophilus]|uniref:DUF1367 family protein n=1 Tax=Coralloluteibacterium thermophilum TaxID=2707049 RepID=A0ABV9NM99_9GAMM
MSSAAKRRPERFALRVVKGGFKVADTFTRGRLRDRGLRSGDLVFAELRKPRNHGFHRLAHQLGALVAENIAAFEGMDPHAVLKRLQIEANVGCDEVALQFPGVGPCVYRVPRSLSFESMEQGEFQEVVAGLCRYIAKTYWPSLSPEAIERMAGCFVEAA